MTQALAHRCARAVGGGSGSFTEDLHAAFTAIGIPAGQLQERINAATGLTGGAAWNAMLSWKLGTIGSQAKTIADLFGASGHIYQAGIGTVSGLTVGNFSDVAGLTPAVADGLVARCNDATTSGAGNITQAIAGQQPTLRTAAGISWWEFTNASNTNLAFASSPVSMASDHAVVVSALTTTASGTRTLFATGGASTQRVATLTLGPPVTAVWRDDAATTVTLPGPTPRLNSPFVFSARQRGQVRELRADGVLAAQNSSTTLGTTTLTSATLGNLPSLIGALQGNLYAAVIINGTVTDDQMVLLETFAANAAAAAMGL